MFPPAVSDLDANDLCNGWCKEAGESDGHDTSLASRRSLQVDVQMAITSGTGDMLRQAGQPGTEPACYDRLPHSGQQTCMSTLCK